VSREFCVACFPLLIKPEMKQGTDMQVANSIPKEQGWTRTLKGHKILRGIGIFDSFTMVKVQVDDF